LSLGLLTAALTAGAWGVPFMPVPDLPETGYVDED
jgi:glutaconate CoA-transferase subunit A